ncbi:MAG: sugar phosphate isomerase/epimerase [Clostridia bacterium]|nr:sugar phosphate isomerase/epimerase [Clostridia bacterium]
MDYKLIMHINYCEQGQSLEQTCEKAAAWGYDGVEFRNKRFNIEEDMEEYLNTIYKAAKKYGIKTVIFGGGTPNLMSKDPVSRERDLEYCENFYPRAFEMFGFEVSNLLIGTVMNPSAEIEYADFTKHGSFIAEDRHWQQGIAGLKRISALAEKFGFKLGLETHPNFIHDTVESAMKLAELSESSNIGVNLDYINANALPGSITIEDAIDKTRGRLFYIHLKNVITTNSGRIKVGLADGEFNNRHIMKKLMESGYQGPICVEAPRSGDREWFAVKDLEYIKAVIKDLA